MSNKNWRIFMKKLLVGILLFSLLMNNFTFASERWEENYVEVKDEVLRVVEQEIGYNNTCLDEYIQREGHLKRWLLWAPPLGVIGTPPATLAGAFASNYIAGAFGWDALGAAILGGFFTYSAGIITTVGVTSVNAVKFYNNRQILNLVVDSYQTNEAYPYKALKKFHRKYRKAWPSDEAVDLATFQSAVKYYDEKGMLCDGSLRGTDMNHKLKYRIVRKLDLFNQIHIDYGNQLN
jgi:hypothetical protein